MTTDVDAVILGSDISYQSVLRRLAEHGVVPRIDHALEFAATNLVLLLHHRPTGVDIDLSFGWTEFENRAIAASTDAAFGRVRAPMARPQDLVVFKAIAGRPQDLEDATSLLLMHGDVDVAAVRRQVTELAALAEAPELVAGLDAVVKLARPTRATKLASGARSRGGKKKARGKSRKR